MVTYDIIDLNALYYSNLIFFLRLLNVTCRKAESAKNKKNLFNGHLIQNGKIFFGLPHTFIVHNNQCPDKIDLYSVTVNNPT